MEARSDRDLLVGAVVAAVLVLTGVVLFFLGQGKAVFERRVTVETDFESITGLRRGSPVQISGVEVGEVQAISFEDMSIACDPLWEDAGRPRRGRRDDCEAQLFCSPEGYCALLEPFQATGDHRPCRHTQDCGAGEVCVTRAFRRRYPRVFWGGEHGYCSRYETVLPRVRVTLAIDEEKLHLLGEDSRAKVASNSVLGDQLVEISRGSGPPLAPGARIRSEPSLYDDLEAFRARVEHALDRFDAGLSRVSGAFERLNEPRITARIKDGIFAVGEVVTDVAEGRGLVGRAVGAPAREAAVAGLAAADEKIVDTGRWIHRADRRLAEAGARIQPEIDGARRKMAEIRAGITRLRRAEEGPARDLLDPSGAAHDALLASVARWRRALADADAGRGTLGGLLVTDQGWEQVLGILGVDARIRTLRTAVRRAVAAYERRGHRIPAPRARRP